MKKFRLLPLLAAVMAVAFCGISFAEQEQAASPDASFGSCAVDGIETNGVTFILNEARCDNSLLTLRITRQPNDTYTSLIDNQVGYPSEDPALVRELEEASQYGIKILGTLCDVLTLTDENGNHILHEYQVASERNGSSLIDTFHIYLPKEHVRQVNIELVFGVNEDLQCRFPQTGSIRLNVANQQSFLAGVAGLTLENGDYGEWSPAVKYRLIQLMNEHGILPDEAFNALSAGTETAIDEWVLGRYGLDSLPGDVNVISLMRIASVEMGIYTDWPNDTWVWFSKMMFETGLWDASSDADVYETPGYEAIPPEKAIEIAKHHLADQGVAEDALAYSTVIWHYTTHASDTERNHLIYIITFRFADNHEQTVLLTPDGKLIS